MNDCERGDINTVCQECACIFSEQISLDICEHKGVGTGVGHRKVRSLAYLISWTMYGSSLPSCG